MKKSILSFMFGALFLLLVGCAQQVVEVDEKTYLTDADLINVCASREVGFDPDLDALCDSSGLSEETGDSPAWAPAAYGSENVRRYSSALSGGRASGLTCEKECCWIRGTDDVETCYCCV